MVEWADLSELNRENGGGDGGVSKRINCFKCANLKITWDKVYPRTCLVFGFSCAEMPSAVVKKTTGRECPAFKQKKP